MHEWRVTVRCPVSRESADNGDESHPDVDRCLYVWTEHPSTVDAYWEALRVLEGWPADTTILDVTRLGMHVPDGRSRNTSS